MDITPISIIGLMIGALIGVLVTEMRPADLRDEAPYAFARARIAQLLARPVHRKWSTHLIWAMSRVLRLEWIAILLFLWFLVLAFWSVSAFRTPLAIDPDWLRNPDWIRHFLVGSLVGFTAAPWVWLHFSRDLLAREGLARYRLQTVILGVVVLFVTFGPQLADMVRSANKVDVLGFSLSLSDHGGSPAQSPVLNNSGTTNSSIGGLNEETGQARDIGNREKQNAIDQNSDLNEFFNSSIFQRDLVYVAYLTISDKPDSAVILRGGGGPNSPNRNLDEYIKAAGVKPPEPDGEFVRTTASLFSCLNYYASTIQDLHLYFIDTSEFLKNLSLEVNEDPTRDGVLSLATGPDNLKELQKSAEWTDEALEAPKGLLPAIQNVLIRAGLPGPPSPDDSSKLKPPIRKDEAEVQEEACWTPLPKFIKPDRTTPYPALLAAYSLAAVESPEAGILYLKKWILKNSPKSGDKANWAKRWYALRAQLALAQIATTTSIQAQLPVAPLVAFERKLTSDFADLIRVNSVGAWKNLCDQLKFRGIHAGVGRSLAFNYATERNFLFELQTPGLFQTWRDSKQTNLVQYLAEDIAEATELTAAAVGNCFGGVPGFDANRRQWRGEFQLNVAQLEIDRLPTLTPNEQEVERTNISRLLEGAANLLGPPPFDSKKEAVEQLLSRVPFDTQRQRLALLQSILNKPRE